MEYLTEALAVHHERAAFSSGVPSLDRYLREQASQDVRRDIARCFVLCREGSTRVLGYYTLSAVAIDFGSLPDDVTHRLPRYPALPAVLLGRLAVDLSLQGQGLGGGLLIDALRRILGIEEGVGIMAVVVDAENERATQFYQHFGFASLLDIPNRLYLPLRRVRELFP